MFIPRLFFRPPQTTNNSTSPLEQSRIEVQNIIDHPPSLSFIESERMRCNPVQLNAIGYQEKTALGLQNQITVIDYAIDARRLDAQLAANKIDSAMHFEACFKLNAQILIAKDRDTKINEKHYESIINYLNIQINFKRSKETSKSELKIFSK